MSLPSQSSVSAGRSYMYRRRRRRLPRVRVVLLGVALAAAGGWVIVDGRFFGPADAGASDGREDGGHGEDGNERSLATTRSPLIAPPRSLTRAEEMQNRSLREAADRVVNAGAAQKPELVPQEPAPVEIRQGSDAQRGEARPASRNDRGSGSPEFARLMEESQVLIAKDDPLAARKVMNTALHLRGASDGDRQRARDALSELNEQLVFSPTAVAGDPISLTHTVAKNEFLSTIVKKNNLGVDWRAILDINRISRPESIREGQSLKLIRGPFHAIVSKGEYRVDLYWGPADKAGEWLYIRSFTAGLGESDSTPTGVFKVKNRLANPAWTNPRTGERFAKDNPENPIGEYWIGLEGMGESAVHRSYGLHGTIEPKSIGSQESMGCVRLLPEDIRLVFSLLREGESVVQIRR